MTSLTDLTTPVTESAEVATIHLVSKHTSMRMIKEMGKVFDHLEDQSSCAVLVLKGTMEISIRDSAFRLSTQSTNGYSRISKWEKICTRQNVCHWSPLPS